LWLAGGVGDGFRLTGDGDLSSSSTTNATRYITMANQLEKLRNNHMDFFMDKIPLNSLAAG